MIGGQFVFFDRFFNSGECLPVRFVLPQTKVFDDNRQWTGVIIFVTWTQTERTRLCTSLMIALSVSD